MKHSILFLALLSSTVFAASPVTLSNGDCLNVCAVSSGGTPTPPSCPTGFHYEGNICVADVPIGGGGGGPTGDISCPGFSHTITLDVSWATPVRLLSGTFHVEDAVVVRFTTGSVDNAANNLPRLSSAEWDSPPSGKTSTLSATACDFSTTSPLGLAAISAGNSIQVPFAVGQGNNFGYYPRLAKNTTYYWNIKNVTSQAQSCSVQNICNIFVELIKPSGL